MQWEWEIEASKRRTFTELDITDVYTITTPTPFYTFKERSTPTYETKYIRLSQ